MIWDVYPITTGLTWRETPWRGNATEESPQFNPKVFTLNAGTHTIVLRGRESGTQIDKISVAQGQLSWNNVGSTIALSIDLLNPRAGAVNDLVIDAIQMTVRYQEPTKNEDGTFINDLERTEVYFEQGGMEHLMARVPASSPTGGIVVSKTFLVPVSLLNDCFIRVYWRAFDMSGNVSQDSTKWGKITNPVPCRKSP